MNGKRDCPPESFSEARITVCARTRIASIVAAIALVFLHLSGTWVAQERHPSLSNNSVGVQMHGVRYHFTRAIVVQIANLDGSLVPVVGNSLPVFDDKNSFVLQIAAARISITPESLARALNSYVFARSDAPLKGIRIAIDRRKIKIKGKLHSMGDVPFQMEGLLAPTKDGRIRVHAEHIKAFHLPVKGVMDLFGISIAGLIKGNKIRGVSADKDDLILNPEQVLPPPHIKGQVTQIRLRGDLIALIVGHARPQKRVLNKGNYMAYSGNRLRFGKLTMNDTDIILIDMDPQDPFDFYLDDYVEQLAAGYTKTTSKFGLRVYMRDFNKLHRPGRRDGN